MLNNDKAIEYFYLIEQARNLRSLEMTPEVKKQIEEINDLIFNLIHNDNSI
jgi:hypothetical protein